MSSMNSYFEVWFEVFLKSCAKLLHFDERSKYFEMVFAKTKYL